MIKAVIFDVDGVLLDSFEANFQFYVKLLEKFDYPAPTREFFATVTHMSMEEALATLAPSADPAKIKEMWDYGRQPLENFEGPDAQMPAGAAQVIAQLSSKYALGIVTSRVKSHIFEGDLQEIKQYFTVVVGYEDTEKHKPNPDPLLLAAEQMSATSEECIYVGDAITDIEAGNAAGMKVIFYGKELPKGAVGLARSFSEIPALIESYDRR